MARTGRRRFDEALLAEALEQHTEMLFTSDSSTETPDAKVDVELEAASEATVAERLFALVRTLYHVLVPIEPSEAFVRDLKLRLAEVQSNPALSPERWRSGQGDARDKSRALRTALSVVAIAAVAARVIASVVVVVAFVMTRRRRSAAAA